MVQIEGAITLQLDARRVFHPDDQLKIIRHVTKMHKELFDAPMPELVASKRERA